MAFGDRASWSCSENFETNGKDKWPWTITEVHWSFALEIHQNYTRNHIKWMPVEWQNYKRRFIDTISVDNFPIENVAVAFFELLLSIFGGSVRIDLVEVEPKFDKIRILFLFSSSGCFGYYVMSLQSTHVPGANRYVSFIFTMGIEIPGIILSQLLLNRMNRRTMIPMMLGLAALSVIVSLLIPKEYSTIALLLFLVGKASMTCAYTSTFVLTAELWPTNIRTTIMNTCLCAGRIGSSLAPFTVILVSVKWFFIFCNQFWKRARTAAHKGFWLNNNTIYFLFTHRITRFLRFHHISCVEQSRYPVFACFSVLKRIQSDCQTHWKRRKNYRSFSQ